MNMTNSVCFVMVAIVCLVIQTWLAVDRQQPPVDRGSVAEKSDPVGKGDTSLWAAVSEARHVVEKVEERGWDMERNFWTKA
jgi:hypothetical protein